jgi:hypothetical protein
MQNPYQKRTAHRYLLYFQTLKSHKQEFISFELSQILTIFVTGGSKPALHSVAAGGMLLPGPVSGTFPRLFWPLPAGTDKRCVIRLSKTWTTHQIRTRTATVQRGALD